jgi:hypothetical protein
MIESERLAGTELNSSIGAIDPIFAPMRITMDRWIFKGILPKAVDHAFQIVALHYTNY